VPPPSCPVPASEPSLMLALVAASIVHAHDARWLSRPVYALVPAGGPRPERLSRLKASVLGALEAALARATRRGRPPRATATAEPSGSALRDRALLEVATGLLGDSRVPLRRRSVQARLVAAFDRLRAVHGISVRDFCAALAIPERTFRAWRARPAAPPVPPAPPAPRPPRPRDRGTGRFALDATAPGTQLGADTTDLRLFGIDLKLVASQDLGAREQRLWEAFALDEQETAGLVKSVVAEAAAGREGLQLLTDQGTPYMADAAKAAYEAIGIEHAPQTEGAPTEKATVERAFGTVKGALAPLLDLTNRLADAIPALRSPELARNVGTLLCAIFLRVYIAGRRHVGHPLAGHDPEVLRAIIAEQREKAHADMRSPRQFLERIHAEYAMPGGVEAFVRTFRQYPLEDLHDAERRFRAYACRCEAKVCDRYFAAVVRDVHEHGKARRAAEQRERRAKGQRRHEQRAAAEYAADLRARPELQLYEGLDVLAATWQPDTGRFLLDGQVGRGCLRGAVDTFHRQCGLRAPDEITSHARSWTANQSALPVPLRQAVIAVLAQVITERSPASATPTTATAFVAAILAPAARGSTDNMRPSPSPRLRI